MTFALHPWRFYFVAAEPIYFPPFKSGNVLRGAFGSIARRFEPSAAGPGPSGLADLPRPFVFRAAHLDGRTIQPGERFHFDLHVFQTRDPALEGVVETFTQVAREGLGPRRGRSELASVWQLDSGGEPAVCLSAKQPEPIVLPLQPDAIPVRQVTVRFVTPTELKSGQALVEKPEFGILFGRARDRVSTLRALYGEGPLDIDFKGIGERAAQVRMTRCELRRVEVDRRSSRTGQVHPIGGFVGEADYEGDLAEFLPLLRAARWTGVGRQTVWGKGAFNLVSAG